MPPSLGPTAAASATVNTGLRRASSRVLRAAVRQRGAGGPESEPSGWPLRPSSRLRHCGLSRMAPAVSCWPLSSLWGSWPRLPFTVVTCILARSGPVAVPHVGASVRAWPRWPRQALAASLTRAKLPGVMQARTHDPPKSEPYTRTRTIPTLRAPELRRPRVALYCPDTGEGGGPLKYPSAASSVGQRGPGRRESQSTPRGATWILPWILLTRPRYP